MWQGPGGGRGPEARSEGCCDPPVQEGGWVCRPHRWACAGMGALQRPKAWGAAEPSGATSPVAGTGLFKGHGVSIPPRPTELPDKTRPRGSFSDRVAGKPALEALVRVNGQKPHGAASSPGDPGWGFRTWAPD